VCRNDTNYAWLQRKKAQHNRLVLRLNSEYLDEEDRLALEAQLAIVDVQLNGIAEHTDCLLAQGLLPNC
jgi:hypothetical protein